MKKTFLTVFMALWLLNCPKAEQVSNEWVTNVSSQEARELIEANKGNENFVILDIRTPAEFEQNRIKGAVNINVADPNFRQTLETLDRNKKYLLYCRSGNRTRTGLAIMEELGFKRVYHLNRGIITETQVLPTESGPAK